MKTTIKLLSKKEIASGTMAFHFEKPEGFTFEAGQNADFALINPPATDEKGNMRTFSFVTAPHEDDLAITTRMRESAFKNTLKNMEEGAEIEINGPMGNFVLHEKSDRPAIFLAGGIGITPYMSMIKDSLHRNLPHKIFLFYSNRRPEDAAYLEELEALDKESESFTMIATMTQDESWQGEKGYISMDMVDRHVPDRSNAVYYITGPQTMVDAMKKMLKDAGVSGDDIRLEEFAGY